MRCLYLLRGCYTKYHQIGNHGGTSEGEVSAVMVFMSPSFERTEPLFGDVKRGKIVVFPMQLVYSVSIQYHKWIWYQRSLSCLDCLSQRIVLVT